MATGCSDEDELPEREISTDAVYDPTIDFSRYRTFAFRDESEADSDMVAELGENRRRLLDVVNQQIDRELREIGLERVPPDEADLLAFSLTNTTARAAITWRCVAQSWGGFWYWGPYDFPLYDPCAWLAPVYVRVDSTTIMAGVVDPELGEVAFVGFVNGIDATGGIRRSEVAAGIHRVFARYPARPAPSDAGVIGAGMIDAAVPDNGMVDAGATNVGAGDASVVDGGTF